MILKLVNTLQRALEQKLLRKRPKEEQRVRIEKGDIVLIQNPGDLVYLKLAQKN